MAPIMQNTYPHLDIAVWLNILDLRQYEGSFRQFVGVEELLHYTETDVKHLGVTKSAHRARIVSSLVALREKAVRLRGQTTKSQPHQQRFSMGVVREKTTSASLSQSDDAESPLYAQKMLAAITTTHITATDRILCIVHISRCGCHTK